MLSDPVHHPVLLIFTIVMLVFSAITIVSSLLLIMALCMDKRYLMIPWIISVCLTTTLDIVLWVYLIIDSETDPLFGVLLAIDCFICLLNVYCLLCVSSQYQEYMAGRGGLVEGGRLPAIRFEPASCAGGGPGGNYANRSPKLRANMIRNGRTSSSYLLPASGASPLTHHLFSRSSISSTSEMSFTSSGGSASSRRGSIMTRDRSDSCYARTTAIQLAAASSILGQTDRYARRLSQLAIEEKSTFAAEEEDEEEIEDDPTHFEIAEIDEADVFVPQQQRMSSVGSTSRFRHSPRLFRRSSDVPEVAKDLTHRRVSIVLKEVSATLEEGIEADEPTTIS